MVLSWYCTLLLITYAVICDGDILRVTESESRSVQNLNGIWDFRADFSTTRDEGFKQMWFMEKLKQTGPVIPMPVPSSYNDITQDKSLRDFVGWVWYETEFYTSFDPNLKRILLRVESAHYYTHVWLNSKPVMTHVGGHLPFEAEVNDLIQQGRVNRLTIAVNNTLTPTTLPPGTIEYKTDTNMYPPGYFVQNLQMDFFNYAGIHRPVLLYTTPKVYIKDVTIHTDIAGNTGIVNYTVTVSTGSADVEILDDDGKVVTHSNGNQGIMKIPNANLWWPYTLSNKTYAYLYTLKLKVGTDIYRQPFGIRRIKIDGNKILINDKLFYCYGFGKHEDSDFRGKGVDLPLIVKDFNLIKWLGANCFRTSHYPYAEEIMDMADKLGIVVIDESPGVGITEKDNMGPESLKHHLSVMKELVQRDKNRPSVIMWSVANEPASSLSEADHYFKTVIEYTRKLDPTRPVTFVMGGRTKVSTELAWCLFLHNDKDVITMDYRIKTYFYGKEILSIWYSDPGHTELIQRQLKYKLTQWYDKFNKPIILTEYGADTIPGLHMEPPMIFSEEYQVEFIRQYHEIFDVLRKDFLVGEMIWNFADFMTAQDIKRVGGNKKGILTRQRQPKTAAFIIRERYHKLTNQIREELKLSNQSDLSQ